MPSISTGTMPLQLTIKRNKMNARENKFLNNLKNTSPDLFQKLRHRYYNLVGLKAWVRVKYSKAGFLKGSSPYDEEFWTATADTDWAGFAKVIIEYTRPNSILDVGCGSGMLLGAFKKHLPSVRLMGLDNSPAALRIAQEAGLPVRSLDFTDRERIRELRSSLGSFDLVTCLEVAEHFPPWYAKRFIKLLTGITDLIVFSAAHPNQGGTLHVNEQPAEYWIKKFRKEGFSVSPADERFQRAISKLEIGSYYQRNIHIFERRSKSLLVDYHLN